MRERVTLRGPLGYSLPVGRGTTEHKSLVCEHSEQTDYKARVVTTRRVKVAA